MKKTLILLIIMALIASFVSCGVGGTDDTETTAVPETEAPTPSPTPVINYTERTYSAEDLFAKAKLQGRTTIQKKGIALDFTAASVSFNAFCEGEVTASVSVSVTPVGGGQKMYASVYVDGVLMGGRGDFALKSTTKKITLATGLEKGCHTFTIERQNESERGNFYIKDLTLTGELAEKPADNKLFIEFIGDSITTAYGNLYPDLADDKGTTGTPSFNEYQDGTRSYACLTAKKLGADYSIVAQQGLGCAAGYYPHTMNSIYEMTCYQTSRKTEWNFERKADVVVIAMGTNDNTFASGGTTTYEKVQKAFEELIDMVREKYPAAKIVWIKDMMVTGASQYVDKAAENKGGEASGIYTLSLPMDSKGGNGHPSASAHAAAAEKLAGFISGII